MDENKNKEGISVKEIEGFVKKYKFEVFLVAMFVLAGIFGMGLIWKPMWGILMATIGGVIGALMPHKIVKLAHSIFAFLLKQDQSTQLIMAGACLVLAILLSPLIFLLMGLHAGKSIHLGFLEIASQGK